MNKLSLLAAAGIVIASLAVGAAPRFAANIASCQNETDNTYPTDSNSFINNDQTALMAALRAQGINAQDISDWGGCMKVDVLRKDGSVAQQFYDPDTLQRLHVNQG